MTSQQTSRTAALEVRFARRLASRLSEGAGQLPDDIEERLRHARGQAIARLGAVLTPVAAIGVSGRAGGGTASLNGPSTGAGWWKPLVTLLPVLALVAGLFLIEHLHAQKQISAAAEIDAALLADDLPPAAYRDPGFLEFLKSARD
jgi:hypothetical protein